MMKHKQNKTQIWPVVLAWFGYGLMILTLILLVAVLNELHSTIATLSWVLQGTRVIEIVQCWVMAAAALVSGVSIVAGYLVARERLKEIAIIVGVTVLGPLIPYIISFLMTTSFSVNEVSLVEEIVPMIATFAMMIVVPVIGIWLERKKHSTKQMNHRKMAGRVITILLAILAGCEFASSVMSAVQQTETYINFEIDERTHEIEREMMRNRS